MLTNTSLDLLKSLQFMLKSNLKIDISKLKVKNIIINLVKAINILFKSLINDFSKLFSINRSLEITKKQNDKK